NQGGGGKFRKFGNSEFFRVIANGRTRIEYLGSLLLRKAEQVCGIGIFHIKGRVLAHDDCVKDIQFLLGSSFGMSPPRRRTEISISGNADSLTARTNPALGNVQIRLQGHADAIDRKSVV